MKFLADEGIDKKLVLELRNLGYDVEYVAETQYGSDDKDLLQRAFENDQVILTKDKDFGELIFRDQLKSNGVILIRLENVTTMQRIEICLEWFLRLDWDFYLKYTTITKSQARVIDLG